MPRIATGLHADGSPSQSNVMRYAAAACRALDDEILDVVVQVGELGEETGEPGPVGLPALQPVAERRRVLVLEVLGDARRDRVDVVVVRRVEVALDGRARRRGHPCSPQISEIVEYTFWLCENSTMLPSGSSTKQT